jgi:purine catabolism regulator
VTSGRDFLTIADLLAMPQLALQLVAGEGGLQNAVLWTHTSELVDPGPWLEGGELLIVNGFGIPEDSAAQVAYLDGLAQHRLAGIVISVRAPELSAEMLEEADRLSFPVLRIPRQIPFIELSYLVANASDRSARSRLARHLQIFETLQLRNSRDGDTVAIYSELERLSGYRLAVVSPTGRPLLPEWSWVPAPGTFEGLANGSSDLRVIDGGFVVPLLVGDRVTAYLIGQEHPGATPGGLAALQHVATLAALDAIDDQRRREAMHRKGGELLAALLDESDAPSDGEDRLADFGLVSARGLRVLAFADGTADVVMETGIRDWLVDRDLPHLLLKQGVLLALVDAAESDLRSLAIEVGVRLGASSRFTDLSELPSMRRQATWSLGLAIDSVEPAAFLAEEELGFAQWLNPDVETIRQLTVRTLQSLLDRDGEDQADLLNTLVVYFRHQGRARPAAAELFVHEHTLSYRLKRIEKLTGRDLRSYRDAFELWLAVTALPLLDERDRNR